MWKYKVEQTATVPALSSAYTFHWGRLTSHSTLGSVKKAGSISISVEEEGTRSGQAVRGILESGSGSEQNNKEPATGRREGTRNTGAEGTGLKPEAAVAGRVRLPFYHSLCQHFLPTFLVTDLLKGVRFTILERPVLGQCFNAC